MAAVKGARPRAYCVPIEPFIRVMDAWLEREMSMWGKSAGLEADTDPIHPTVRLGMLIWPGATKDTTARRLFEMRNVQKWIDFDVADRILCVLEMNHLWVTDPEFAEIYQTVPLPTLDFVRPTCEQAHAESRSEVQKLIESIGIGATAKTYGIDAVTVKRNLEKAAACA